jgi:hypothetical protein
MPLRDCRAKTRCGWAVKMLGCEPEMEPPKEPAQTEGTLIPRAQDLARSDS